MLSIPRLAALLCLAASPALAWVSPVPDVVVDCSASLTPIVQRLADAWFARSQVGVHVFAGPPARLVGLIRHRARADLVIAEPAVLATLRTEHLLSESEAAPLGVDPYVLIAAAPAGSPDATLSGTSAADLAAQVPAIVTDPTTAAEFDGQGLLRRIAATAPAPQGVPDSAAVVRAVAASPGRIGLVRQTDIADTPGLRIAARVPAGLAAPVPMVAALTRNGQSGRASAFLAFITGPGAMPLWRHAGLESAP